MTMHCHHLQGCAPAPLAHYLKAIGILRVIAQQKDVQVRGFWSDEHFCLLTTLDEDGIYSFFLREYQPTPFLSPWNRGSGFYTKDDKGLSPIEASQAPRFEAFRQGIREARLQLDAITKADARVREIKDRTKTRGLSKEEKAALENDPAYKQELNAAQREFQRLKGDLYGPFALTWRGPHRDWMDAAMVLSPDGEPAWPALLGTGGNDGRLDFTNTAMQRLGDLFDLASEDGHPAPRTQELLKAALFDTPTAALLNAAIGQFLPGLVGGANGTTGPEADSLVNPWDFILMLEGTVAFRGQSTRRLGVKDDQRAAVPFAVVSGPAGNVTRGKEPDRRGEQWMPLWERPASWQDVSALIGEGRAQSGRSLARRPIEFASAVARLGVARGLSGFVRYGFLERNGQSNLAVPLGRIEVAEHPQARLIDEIGVWLNRLQHASLTAPARLSGPVGLLADAVFDVLTREAEPLRWQSILAAIDQVQRVQAEGTAFEIGPCPKLSTGWLEAASDDSPEWRLALSLGSAAGAYEYHRPVDGVCAHTLPLAPGKWRKYATDADKRLVNDPRVVMTGRDPLADLIALVDRRLTEASQHATRTLPLVAAPGAGARLEDLARFLVGEVDVERVVTLGRSLMALDWGQFRPGRVHAGRQDIRPDEAWEALRLCAVPFEVHNRNIATDPALFRRLAAGDASGAVELALRRLRASGFRPPIVAATGSPMLARRWAAAFAFPIDSVTADRMASRFVNPTEKETP